jgi:hypothetical protein
MKRLIPLVFLVITLLLLIAVIREHRASRRLQEAFDSVQLRMQELAEQVTALQQEQQRAIVLPGTSAGIGEDKAELARLHGAIARLQERLAQLERVNAGISNDIAAARGANIPFVYPDSTKRADYAFTGYSTPQSAIQSVLWSINKGDAKAFLESVTGTVAEAFATQFQDLPEGVMPGGFRNGAMFKATGFRVVEETPTSEDEIRLKVFLEGSRTMIQPVFRRVGGEWKWSRNER